MDGPYGLGVTGRAFGLKGPRGWAFREVSFEAEPGSLIAVEGPSGSGRTCLLLALTGRMRATEGSATVGEWSLPKQLAAVRRASALAHVPGVTDLDPALTVGEHLREGRCWSAGSAVPCAGCCGHGRSGRPRRSCASTRR